MHAKTTIGEAGPRGSTGAGRVGLDESEAVAGGDVGAGVIGLDDGGCLAAR